MQEKGYPEIAKICLSHCFYEQDFKLETYPHNLQYLLRCKELLKTFIYGDYDRLIQLVDMTNDMGKFCTIEFRFASISNRYNVPLQKREPMLKLLNNIKHYFDTKIGQDIYKILGIANDERVSR